MRTRAHDRSILEGCGLPLGPVAHHKGAVSCICLITGVGRGVSYRLPFPSRGVPTSPTSPQARQDDLLDRATSAEAERPLESDAAPASEVVGDVGHRGIGQQHSVLHGSGLSPTLARKSPIAGNPTAVVMVEELEMSDSVGQYLNEIGLVPLLTADEERELSQTIERGRHAQERIDAGERSRELRKTVAAAAAAKDRFIRANLRLVVSIARRYPLPPSMELLDLIQEGNLGLEHAVDKFDWRKGFKFSTYATFWIRQAIGRALDQKASLVRLPGDRSASLRAALRQASGDGEELDDENARLYRLTTPTSLDRPVGDDDGSELVDLLAADVPTPEQVLVDHEEEQTLHDLLGVLDGRARYAVEQRFGLTDGRKRSYREVGEELGVTAEAARRLVKRAVDAVREEAVARSSAA